MAISITTVRAGVQFILAAALAFMRAEAQVMAEFGRRIRVNSTYRSWATQLSMYYAWIRYVASGYKASMYPGHSKAVHPSESFHVNGTAMDSPDWTIARIVQILADNGFIRNRLHVPNEQHHFEYDRSRDKNYGKPLPGAADAPKPTPPVPKEDDDMLFLEITVGARTHKCALGNGSFRHFVPGDPHEHLMKLWRFDDQWQPIDIQQLPAALRTAACDLHIWDIRNGEFVVLDPLDGSVKSGNVWSAVNALRSTVGEIKVTSEETAEYVKQLAEAEAN